MVGLYMFLPCINFNYPNLTCQLLRPCCGHSLCLNIKVNSVLASSHCGTGIVQLPSNRPTLSLNTTCIGNNSRNNNNNNNIRSLCYMYISAWSRIINDADYLQGSNQS